jgi:Aminoglycoside/hydroxyurea antibiotic resistance kinase
MGQLDDLAQAAAECRENWGLRPDGEFPHRYGHVEPVRMRDGTPAVLKLGPDLHLDALRWFSGHGRVRVLAIDHERGAALATVRRLPARARVRGVADRLEPLTGR